MSLLPGLRKQWQLLHDPKLQQGFWKPWPTFNQTISELKKSVPSVFGGKTGSKKRVTEIADIVTWTEAFTIFWMTLCHTFPLLLERCKPVQATHYSDSKVLLSQIMAPLRHRLQKRSASLVSHAPRPLQFSHQISGHHFSRFRILNLFCLGPNTAWEDW